METSCYFRRVSAKQLGAIINAPHRLQQVLFPSSSETAIDDDIWIDLGEEWKSLHEALVKLNPALALLERGGSELGVVGDRPARGFSSDDVRKVGAALTLLTADRLDDALQPTFETLKDFVVATGQAEAGMIVFWR